MTAKDYRERAWFALNGKWGTMALCAFISSIILGACGSFSVVSRFDNSLFVAMFSFIGSIGSLLLGGPFAYGAALLSLNVARGAAINTEQLFAGFKNYGKTLALYIINSIFVALWSLLLIVPGIIKAISYSMSYYILIDQPELDANDARKQSMALMEGHKWKYFCLQLSFIGWLLLCLLTLGILSFWVTPYINTANAEFYQSLIAPNDTPAQNNNSSFLELLEQENARRGNGGNQF